MRLLFVRHGDPDYVNDTLTEKGHREAKLLADIIEQYRIDEVYQSPLGRAKDCQRTTYHRGWLLRKLHRRN